jgi:anti-sigma regulatory factor (Ser/Thr protein kinase)
LAKHGEAKFPAELASIGQARSFVQNECRADQSDETIETAVLLTSELVTNAVEHAGRPPGSDDSRHSVTRTSASAAKSKN